MRKMIVVDCTFLTGKYKGALLSAMCQDGNEQIYPLAFGIADGENDRSWEWFFCQLGSFIPDTADTVFISDRHASISRAIRKVYPSAKHGVCTYHLSKNLMTKFKCKRGTPLFKEAALAFTRSHFDRVFDQLRKIDEGVAKYLEEIDVRMWSRAYFEGCRYNIMTSNIAESWNSVLKGAKDYPIVPLFEHIRQTLTQWFFERRVKAASWSQTVTPAVTTHIDILVDKARKLQVNPISAVDYQVKGGHEEYVVNLTAKTCSCRAFDMIKMPCIHAIGAATWCKMSVHELVDPVYSTTTWRSAYADCINPINVPIEEWQVEIQVADQSCAFPSVRRPPGRPKKRRQPSFIEGVLNKARRPNQCRRCGQRGHNRATYKEYIR
ncbi:PREDICTED: uncharacterized protein LOC104809906 [Tarenaya hassleriana]|uniref:uncharacterized protein LOC104809906 n=1 Tax=Tarenaya hassleriana TaxID=28532 RepID=UPI00053CA0F3|nr:PREDICTED: uncharacterized protein LOC104809906 [Tarenaya hassleriana]XP_010534316.1 PREDICTED: uncharacterized protein LOC104809906 [Tarenaya hassleriana]